MTITTKTLLERISYLVKNNSEIVISLRDALATQTSVASPSFTLNNHWETFMENPGPLSQSPLQDLTAPCQSQSLHVFEFGRQILDYLATSPIITTYMEMDKSNLHTSLFTANGNVLTVGICSIVQPLLELTHVDQQYLFQLAQLDAPIHGFTQKNSLDMEMLYMAIRLYKAHISLLNTITNEGAKTNLINFFKNFPIELKNKPYTLEQIEATLKLAEIFIVLDMRNTVSENIALNSQNKLATGYNTQERLNSILSSVDTGMRATRKSEYHTCATYINGMLSEIDTKKGWLSGVTKQKGIEFKPLLEEFRKCLVLLCKFSPSEIVLVPVKQYSPS